MNEEPEDAPSSERTDKRPRGRGTLRRRYLRAAERRDQIIAAAQQVFALTSLQGAKTRDLAKAAKVNQATLFEHFSSKEALFQEAVIQPILDAMRGMRERAHTYESATSVEELGRLAHASAQRHLEVMIKIFPLLTSALFSDLESGKKLYREHIAPLLRERARAISGLVRSELDPEFVELAGFGTLFAMAMDHTLREQARDPATLLDQWLLLTTSGFAKAQLQPHQVQLQARTPSAATQLSRRRRLGRFDLELSPLTLGTHAIGRGASGAEKLLEHYLERGGNCIDFADTAAGGPAENELAKVISKRRESIVLACHCSLSLQPHDGSHGEDAHRIILRAVDGSLARLKTDYIDLLFIDSWDPRLTPSELLAAVDDLRRANKIRYVGLSDVPAWQAARLHTMAEAWRIPLVALQAPHSLLNRAAERDLLAMAHNVGLGVLSRSPFGGGVLAVKHSRLSSAAPVAKTKAVNRRSNKSAAAAVRPDGHRAAIIATLNRVAEEIRCTPAQAALAWALLNPAVVSPVVNPRTLAQLEDCLGALDITLSANQIERLDRVSRIDDSQTSDLVNSR